MSSAAAELLASARSAICLTGAGVSAESGIPTFRGEGGLWRKYDPFKVSSISYFMDDPSAYWSVARERGRLALQAKPNPGHFALAEMERAGRLRAVITQNTDGLHRDAGSTRVIELHGSGRTVECLDCHAQESRASLQERLEIEMPPRCRVCGGAYLKPTVVLFGESLPAGAVEEAFTLARSADVCLVAGSSLVVYPAAQIPLVALEAGAALIIVNAEPTPFDHLAAAVIHGRSGEVLPQLVSAGSRV